MVRLSSESFSFWLQWGRRVNTAECRISPKGAPLLEVASMGPPREHGGMAFGALKYEARNWASMGPPREHGGMRRCGSCDLSGVGCFNGAAA